MKAKFTVTFDPPVGMSDSKAEKRVKADRESVSRSLHAGTKGYRVSPVKVTAPGRPKINPASEAKAKALIATQKYSNRQIAAHLGISHPTVARIRRGE